MAFKTLKTIDFQKKHFLFSQFCSFYCLLVTHSRQLEAKMTNFLSGEVVKGIDVTQSNVFKEFVMTLLASTRVFFLQKQIN